MWELINVEEKLHLGMILMINSKMCTKIRHGVKKRNVMFIKNNTRELHIQQLHRHLVMHELRCFSAAPVRTLKNSEHPSPPPMPKVTTVLKAALNTIMSSLDSYWRYQSNYSTKSKIPFLQFFHAVCSGNITELFMFSGKH